MKKGPPIDRAISLEKLVRMRDILASHRIPCFLTFGRLLGALPERHFIHKLRRKGQEIDPPIGVRGIADWAVEEPREGPVSVAAALQVDRP